jgi:tetratricopeptide (TPR) repeat protein
MRRLGTVLAGLKMAAICLLSSLLTKIGLWRLGVSLVRLGIRSSPAFETTYLGQLALIHERIGRTEEAIGYLRDVSEKEPDNAFNYFELGLAHEKMEQRDLARINFERALALGTDFGAEFRAQLESRIRLLN